MAQNVKSGHEYLTVHNNFANICARIIPPDIIVIAGELLQDKLIGRAGHGAAVAASTTQPSMAINSLVTEVLNKISFSPGKFDKFASILEKRDEEFAMVLRKACGRWRPPDVDGAADEPPSEAAMPEYNNLIQIKLWDGFHNHSIAKFIALHDPVLCDNFANLLLQDNLLVTETRRNNPDNHAFINAILQKWHFLAGVPAVKYTWRNLVDCMKQAGLRRNMVQIIESNVC